MQTFLPCQSFHNSAIILDVKRHGKQRVEAFQIDQALIAIESGEPHGWKNHPAVRMWEGHRGALRLYYNIMLEEWERKGYNNIKLQPLPVSKPIKMPWWLGNPKFHSSHRSNLMRKDPEFYGQYNWSEKAGMPYWWPTGDNKDEKS